MTIKDSQAAEWRRVTEAVVPGPWTIHRVDRSNILDANGVHVCRTIDPADGSPDHEADFIALSREAMPALLDERDELRGLLRAARNEIEAYREAERLLGEENNVMQGELLAKLDAALGGE